jgi:hypothetical protein
MPVKKPFLRVTKWLGDIPVEAQCRACPDVNFRVHSTNARPNREEYAQALQRQFDDHVKSVHSSSAHQGEDGGQT